MISSTMITSRSTTALFARLCSRRAFCIMTSSSSPPIPPLVVTAATQSHSLPLLSSLSVPATITTQRTFSSSSSSSSSSDNITYSGGHASTGQGGYYGSGGARAKAEHDATNNITQEQRSKVLAISSDVQLVQQFLEELDTLEDLLREEEEASGGKVTGRSEELRSKRKHLVSNPKFLQCLDQLQIEGAPVWGLSSEEHEMVVLAREKVNSC